MPFPAEKLSQLYTAVLSDVLDELGYMNQAMRPFMRPTDETLTFYGRARTGLYMPAYALRPGENPYEVEIRLIDDLKPGDVPVLACNGPTIRIAPWGELLTTASIARGAVGCVTDGLIRDVRQIRAKKFPVFHGGIGPLDTKGRARMVDMDVPVECAGVKVETGDLVFGDVDGLIVVPQTVASEAIDKAHNKVMSENRTREELENGVLLGEVFRKFGVL
jgi:4-hydroxy-4-methyl-2-oxoglutarate aldolase